MFQRRLPPPPPFFPACIANSFVAMGRGAAWRGVAGRGPNSVITATRPGSKPGSHNPQGCPRRARPPASAESEGDRRLTRRDWRTSRRQKKANLLRRQDKPPFHPRDGLGAHAAHVAHAASATPRIRCRDRNSRRDQPTPPFFVSPRTTYGKLHNTHTVRGKKMYATSPLPPSPRPSPRPPGPAPRALISDLLHAVFPCCRERKGEGVPG